MSFNISSICCWNANSLRSKREEFYNFLNNKSIDIIGVSELKIHNYEENIFNQPHYYNICKARNVFGGGISVFININIEYEED